MFILDDLFAANINELCKICCYIWDVSPCCPFPASRSPAEIPPRIPGLAVSGRWGNDLTTIPNPVNRDMDSTHQPPPTPDYVLP